MDTQRQSHAPSEEDLMRAERLRRIWDSQRHELGLTQQYAGEVMGITQGAVGHYLNGRDKLSPVSLKRFQLVLNFNIADVDPAWAEAVEGIRVDGKSGLSRIPIAGTASLDSGGVWRSLDKSERAEMLDLYSLDPVAYAIRIRGTAMAPAILDGWFVLVEPDRKLVPGEPVVILNVSGETSVRELLYSNAFQVSVCAINDPYARMNLRHDDITAIHAIGGWFPPSRAYRQLPDS